jgi:hypothetical protein
VADAEGPTGSFKATTLSPTAKWEVRLQSGDFTWSYPIKVPDVPGGEPQLSIEYSSSSVDGRAASSNNQPSWVGEGFELSPGYIERSYRTCDDDPGGNAGINDKCWVSDNAMSTFPGLSGELVRDDTTGAWKSERDKGWRIDRPTGTVNGDNDGEYWRLTSPEGTQYFFGISAVMGTMEGSSASVRAGRLVVPTKSGSRAATGKEVDDFIAGWGWGVGVGAWNRQAAIARSVGSNVTAFEFGTPIYSLGSGAPLFSLLPKLPPDVGISFGYVWKLNLW